MFRDFRISLGIGTEDYLRENNCFRHDRHSERRRHFAEKMFGHGDGDEHRTRRGDIKFLLLELLLEQPSHGYDLIKQMETRYGGFRRLSPGSVYPTLQLLEDGGYVTSEQRDGKRIYTITDQGRQFLAERTQKESSTYPEDDVKNFTKDRPQEFSKLSKSASDLSAAVIQVARGGDAEQMNRVRELLDQVKRDIYSILAQK